MMKQLTERYPDTEAAQQAKRDLYLIEAFVKRDMEDRQKQVRAAMKRIADALIRYKTKKSEYPASLSDLMPEYLDQVPETPWGHPFLYRPYVSRPIEDFQVNRGPAKQKLNTKFDGYYLACLGTDLSPAAKGSPRTSSSRMGSPGMNRPSRPCPSRNLFVEQFHARIEAGLRTVVRSLANAAFGRICDRVM